MEISDTATAVPPSEQVCHQCSSRNLSFLEHVQLGISNYLSSPQMWPVGYILDSPYSPFQIEMQDSNRDWRAAFEDLLCLENGRDMISLESRKEESQLLREIALNNCLGKLESADRDLQDNYSYTKWSIKLGKVAAKEHDTEAAKSIQQHVAERRKLMDDIASEARSIQDQVRQLREPFSDQESIPIRTPRTWWLSSLVASGALRKWTSVLTNSEHGLRLAMHKPDDPSGGVGNTETELSQRFEAGSPYVVSHPAWDTDQDRYPDVTETFKSTSELPPPEPLEIEKSLLRQVISCDFVKRLGRDVPQVRMTNSFSNGDTEEQLFIDDRSQVLRRMDHAYRDMAEYEHALATFQVRYYARLFEQVVQNDGQSEGEDL